MSFPVIRLLGGGQPIGGIDAPEFLLHFVPYYAVALTMAAVAGAGSYTFAAFALSAANFWIHVLVHDLHRAAQEGLLRRDPEEGRRGPPAGGGDARARVPSGYCSRPASTASFTNPDAATINNVSFAAVPRLDPHDRMLGGAPETAGSGRRVVRARGGRGMSRRVRDAWSSRPWRSEAIALGFARRVRWDAAPPLARSSCRAPGPRPPPPPGTSWTATSPPTDAFSGIDQGGDTVGEGQAYGMLLAAAIGDAQRFDTIWGWTKDNLRRPDGLISFLWRNGHVLDPQAASDADLDATRALLVAALPLPPPRPAAGGARRSGRRSCESRWPLRSRARRC